MQLIKPSIVIFHCSATPDFKEGDLHFDRFTIEDVERWHRERGFEKCGYHFVITRKGLIQTGRWCTKDEVEKGAHCQGQNYRSIGVCYIGSKDPSPQQRESIRSLYLLIEKVFSIPSNDWYPHCYFNIRKSCPGFGPDELNKLLSGAPV